MDLNRVIVALDFPSLKEVKGFIPKVESDISFVKVGMELFYSEGIKVLDYLKNKNLKIFLDLKLHDIPNTVYRSLKVINEFNIDMVNVHALGGSELLKKSREAITNSKTKVIGVTLLTSHNHQDIHRLNLLGNIENNVKNLANLCYQSGLDGIVCSGQDLDFLNYPFLYVTPGVRMGSKVDDQKRVITPKEAFKKGATHIVMGREITQSATPQKVIQDLKEHLS